MKASTKSFKKFIFISLPFVVLLGLYSATQSALLDVDEIEVLITGGSKITSDEVITASGILVSQSMISADTK